MFSMIMLCMTLLTISCKSTNSIAELSTLQSAALNSILHYDLTDTLFPLSINYYPTSNNVNSATMAPLQKTQMQNLPTLLPPMARHATLTATKSQTVQTSTQNNQTIQSEPLPVAAARSLVATIIVLIVLFFVIAIVFRLLHV